MKRTTKTKSTSEFLGFMTPESLIGDQKVGADIRLSLESDEGYSTNIYARVVELQRDGRVIVAQVTSSQITGLGGKKISFKLPIPEVPVCVVSEGD